MRENIIVGSIRNDKTHLFHSISLLTVSAWQPVKTIYNFNMIRFLLALCFLLPTAFSIAQTIQPAEYKKHKKVQLSHQYTTYTDRDGDNIPAMRIPFDKVEDLHSPAQSFLMEAQALLADAELNYSLGDPIRELDRLFYCIDQIKGLDPFWEYDFLLLEAKFYRDYERARYQREVVEVRRRDSLRYTNSQAAKDSLSALYLLESRRADSLEQARQRYLASKKDSILFVERTRGYHFVNAQSIGLRAEPDPTAKLIVNLRVCTYVRVLSEPDILGYVFVEVSDYKGYVLKHYLVDNLDKITVRGADVKFAKNNFYVSIYIPAGYTYDPLRPQHGAPPQVLHPHEYEHKRKNNPPTYTATNALDKAANSQPTPAPAPPIVPPVVEKEKTTLSPAPQPTKEETTRAKKPRGTTKLHQCEAIKSDGTRCTNMTTMSNHRCYMHDE